MDNLAKLQDKWTPADPAPDPPPTVSEPEQPARPVKPVQLTRWRDSAAVVELSAYLKQCGHISLGIRAGLPTLDINPPLGPADYNRKSTRLAQAVSALDLLLAASSDLAALLSKGLIRLPVLDPDGLTVMESKTEAV